MPRLDRLINQIKNNKIKGVKIMITKFNFSIWVDYKEVKKVTVLEDVVDGKIKNPKRRTHFIDLGDGLFSMSSNDLFGYIKERELIPYMGKELDIDIFMHPNQKLKWGQNNAFSTFTTINIKQDNVEFYFVGTIIRLNNMINKIHDRDIIDVTNACANRFKGIRNQLQDEECIKLYDAFYRIMDANREDRLMGLKMFFKNN